METTYYIGLDVHKKTISYCVKDSGGRIYAEGSMLRTTKFRSQTCHVFSRFA
jgi:hypothetical protein